MSAVVADTHTIIWYLTAPENLSAPAESALAQAEAVGDAICIVVSQAMFCSLFQDKVV